MLSLLVPVRDWPADRVEACVASFLGLQSPSLSEVIVVDFGSAEPLSLSRNLVRKVKRLRLDAPIWSLAEAINAGVAMARNDLIAKTDADIIVSATSREEFEHTVRRLASRQVALAMTQATDLHQSIGPQQAAQAILAGEQLPSKRRPKWGQGGLVFFRRDVWAAIGGFDSRFVGWGNEDNDFAERVRRAGYRVGWTARDKLEIFHVWHPPSFATTGVVKLRAGNQKIAREDRSVFRALAFRHSNAREVLAPEVMRKLTPLVTLAIATTARPHRERMLCEAINSFRGQLNGDYEVVVVDNGSDDRQFGILGRALGRLRCPGEIRLERLRDGSIPAARNHITQAARAPYICVVDDDDLALPNRLSDHLRVFERDGLVHGSHGGWIDFDESTGVIERNSGKERTIATLLKGSGKITAHPASFYRTDVLRAVPYDENFALGSDFDLALRLANLGFEIAHTNTFVTLRRFHSSNVTITGLSNQVSNGTAARSRTIESFAWRAGAELERQAKEKDGPVYCRNQMSFDSIATFLPKYSGTWQVLVPLQALARFARTSVPPVSQMATDGPPNLQQPLTSSAPPADRPLTSLDIDPDRLAALVNIVDGALGTDRPGLDQPVFYRSRPIDGLQRAQRTRRRIEDLLERPAQLTSVRQFELDRLVPFDWKTVAINPGERVLLSSRFPTLEQAMLRLASVGRNSLAAGILAVLSDADDEGECYFLVTRPVRGYDPARTLKFDLERLCGLPFTMVSAQGVASDLTPNRNH